MEQLVTFVKVLGEFGQLGLVGIIVFIWWKDQAVQRKLFETYRADITKILSSYEKDMAEQREMYRSNVSLVRDYQSVAGDLKDIVILATQTMTTLHADVNNNRFCPMVRVESGKTRFEVSPK